MRKTVIIGMNNPLRPRSPEYALYPAPVNCAGWRLWKMLWARTSVTEEEYVERFDRRNLLQTREWKAARARDAAVALEPELLGRRVVVLGTAVRDAFRLPPVLVKPVSLRGITWRQLPHPSGRCRWYNDPKNRAVAGLLLEEEFRRCR